MSGASRASRSPTGSRRPLLVVVEPLAVDGADLGGVGGGAKGRGCGDRRDAGSVHGRISLLS